MIKLYSKTVCPKCVVAKSFFNANNVQFENINIDTNEEGRQKLLDLGFMAVPIVEYNGKYFSNMQEFQQLLDDLQ